jgi:hypothetical protein
MASWKKCGVGLPTRKNCQKQSAANDEIQVKQRENLNYNEVVFIIIKAKDKLRCLKHTFLSSGTSGAYFSPMEYQISLGRNVCPKPGRSRV